jgi:hypothetical protein
VPFRAVVVGDLEADVMDVVGSATLGERPRVRAAVVERLDELDAERRRQAA